MMRSARTTARRLGGLALLAAILTAPADPAAAASPAAALVQTLGDEVVTILRQPGTTEAQRRERFRDLFTGYFDVPAMARFVVGRHWRTASEPQRAEHVALFRDYVADIYARQFAAYAGETFTVLREQALSDADTLVKAEIVRPGGRPPLAVDFRVAAGVGGLKITDVVVEAVSLLVTKRSEFQSVLSQKGMDGFLAQLREQVARQKNGESG